MDSGLEHSRFRVYTLSERALTVEVGDVMSEEVLGWVMATQQAIQAACITGVVEVVTAYTTVTVVFDPQVVYGVLRGGQETALEHVRGRVEEILAGVVAGGVVVDADTVVIPVCYEEAFAPDLKCVAEHHGTTAAEIVRRHTSHTFLVFMVGFTPGFPYMGILPEGLQSPRKAVPRMRVPAGSVGLAGKQTGIYPYATPGGWQIIGRTPLILFDPHRAAPSWLAAGRRVRFEAISSAEFNRMQA